MKKLFFALFIALAVIGCKKKTEEEEGGGGGGGDTPTPSTTTISFNNGKEGKLTINVGASEVISIKGASLSQVDVVSSDTNTVYIYDGVMYGIAEGNAIVTATLKSDASVKATLQVTVAEYYKNMKFSECYWMQGSESWHDATTSVIRKRSYRGAELPDAGDAQLTRDNSHAGDTADIDSWVDEFQVGKWYFLYDTTIMGEDYSIGLFLDSIRCRRSWMLTPEVFFNGDGELTIAGEGGIFEFSDFYMYDIKYSYCLGDRYFTEDVTEAGKQYTRVGEEKNPYPGYIQVGHFNDANYIEYFTRVLNEEEPERDDYPFYEMYDSFFKIMGNGEDETSGETWIWSVDLGYPVLDDTEEMNFYIGSDDNTGWFKMEYYYVEAMINPEYGWYGFKSEYDEEQGGYTFVYPLELADFVKVTYHDGQVPSEARGKNGARRRHSEIPVRTTTLERQMSVSNTIGATLRAVLSR